MSGPWIKIAKTSDIPSNGGACVLVGEKQIAVFNFQDRNEWYACQNLCPHQQEMVLSRGLIGDLNGEPKVACPMHKRTFSLRSGACLSEDPYQITVYGVKAENGDVYLNLTP